MIYGIKIACLHFEPSLYHQYCMQTSTLTTSTLAATLDSTSHGTRTNVAAQRLRELIVTGRLKPGQRISERSLLEQHAELSRTPLREALKILDYEGLVQLHPNKGAYVTRLSMSQIDAAIEILIGLEKMAAPLSCLRMKDREIVWVVDLHQQMLAAVTRQDLLAYFTLNQTIHQRIIDGAHNPVLSRLYHHEALKIRRYRYAGNIAQQRWQHAVQEHGQILQALQDRDGSLLCELLRAHHTHGWASTREVLATEFQDAVPGGE